MTIYAKYLLDPKHGEPVVALYEEGRLATPLCMIHRSTLYSINRSLAPVATGIKAARKSRGLTQQDLADKSGLSRTYIGRLERGDDTHVSLAVARTLARILACSVDHLFPHEDDEDA